jgi:hypothetical protein
MGVFEWQLDTVLASYRSERGRMYAHGCGLLASRWPTSRTPQLTIKLIVMTLVDGPRCRERCRGGRGRGSEAAD